MDGLAAMDVSSMSADHIVLNFKHNLFMRNGEVFHFGHPPTGGKRIRIRIDLLVDVIYDHPLCTYVYMNSVHRSDALSRISCYYCHIWELCV